MQLFQVSPGGGYGSPDWAELVGKHTGYVFYCEDIQITYEELSDKGVRFTVPPQKQDWGGVEGTFVDPDGNGFELVEQPKIRVMK
ncbi:VOC family protein [Brevibacillus massiliensis]|uniref:VOC family protein n=1 Tax=Brevibacillus massiliensis TaxID=1118054 RepID=UPI0009D93BC0